MSRVYLDWAATAPPNPEILDSASRVAARYFGNPSAVHVEGREAAGFLQDCRGRMAALLECQPEEVVFTAGGTESNNMVLFSMLQPAAAAGGGTLSERRRQQGAPAGIVLSAIEHASIYQPAMTLRRYGFRVELVPAGPGGRVDPQRVIDEIDEHTVLVALMLVNNETGALQPVAEVGRALRNPGLRGGRRIHFHCDAVQGFGKLPVHPRTLSVDSLSLSAHKLGGPRGVGALYLRRGAAREFLYSGGGQEGGRRAGTENLPGIHGLVLSAEAAHRGMDRDLERARSSMAALVRELAALDSALLVPGERGADSPEFSPYILNAAFPPVPGEVMVRVLEEEGYVVSTGSACSSRKKDRSRVHLGMGIPAGIAQSSIRVSLGAATQRREVEGLAAALKRRLPEGPGGLRVGPGVPGKEARAVPQQEPHNGQDRALFLLKYGELSLKGRNRESFIRRVEENIRGQLEGIDCLASRDWGRMYLSVPGTQAERVAEVLRRTFGLVGFSRTLLVQKDMEQIRAAAATLAEGLLAAQGRRFKIEARRSDKSFPLTSYQIAADVGGFLRERFEALEVDVHHPDWVLNVEIRKQASLSGPAQPAPGGLPVGSSGRGLVLLSGGIDSPAAAYLMAKRGLAIDTLYFDTPPYTSPQARDKVARLAAILRDYAPDLRLYVAPFTELQLRIRSRARREESTLMVRAAMMRIAERMAGTLGCYCIVTGENLGQVASQTVQSMHFTGSMTTLPLFRPLIGLDKDEIIRLARRIGTFETSILPYEDCCTLFSPPHPVVRPDFGRMQRSFRKLDAGDLIDAASREAYQIS